jgi:hypothetical protein
VLGTAAAKQWSKLGSHLKHLNLTFPSVSFHSGIRNDPAFFVRDRAKRGADAVIGSGRSAAFAKEVTYARRLWLELFQPIVSRLPPAALDRYPRGFSGHVAHPSRSIDSFAARSLTLAPRGFAVYVAASPHAPFSAQDDHEYIRANP